MSRHIDHFDGRGPSRESHVLRRRGERQPDAVGNLLPVGQFFLEPPPAGGSQAVVLRLPLVFRLAPFGRNQALVLQPVQGGVQRSLLNLETITGDLLNPKEHAVAVKRAQRHRLENQQIERALQQLGRLAQTSLLDMQGE